MNINLDLLALPNNSTRPNSFKNLFRAKLSLADQTQTLVYTDAYLTEGRVGMTFVYEDNRIQWKLSDKVSMCTAEAL